ASGEIYLSACRCGRPKSMTGMFYLRLVSAGTAEWVPLVVTPATVAPHQDGIFHLLGNDGADLVYSRDLRSFTLFWSETPATNSLSNKAGLPALEKGFGKMTIRISQRSRISVLIGFLAGALLITSTQASAAPGIVSRSGQPLTSLFDGLKPTHSQPLAFAMHKTWNGKLRSRLPGVLPVVIFGGGNCPGWEDCSGAYTILEPALGGCDVGDGEDCPIYNFTNSPEADCRAG